MNKLLKSGADVFCISCMTSNAPRGYELADMIHAKTNARVIMGGMHPTWMPDEALQHADQVITGEGEKVILDDVEGRITDRLVKGIPLTCLDEAPFPDYSILKTPCEAADKERAKEICRRMIAEKLTFKETFFFGRTDLADDEELLQLLHDAHLTRVLIGIESLNQQALNDIHKGQNIDNIRRAAAACEKYRIRMIASIVLGLDADKKEDMDRSIEFARDIHAYQLQPAILTPFPGTPVYEQFEEEGRMITHEWSRFDMMNVTYMPKNMSPWELQEEFYHAARMFYDYDSAKIIGKLFGKEYERRRRRFAFVSNLGVWGAHVSSHINNGNCYYELRHYKPGDHEMKTEQTVNKKADKRQKRRSKRSSRSRGEIA